MKENGEERKKEGKGERTKEREKGENRKEESARAHESEKPTENDEDISWTERERVLRPLLLALPRRRVRSTLGRCSRTLSRSAVEIAPHGAP